MTREPRSIFGILQAQARLFNADKPFSEVLNSYFTPNLEKNEAIIREFASSGHLFDQDGEEDG